MTAKTIWGVGPMKPSAALVPLLAITAAGCAITPLPENYSGKATYDIVHKIRCEAREAVQNKAIALMIASDAPDAVRAEGFALKSDNEKFYRYDYKKLPKEYASAFERYAGTVLAYQFVFDITETSANKGTVNFKGPVGLDVFSLGWTSNGTLKRENNRTFRMADTFRELALEMTKDYCDGQGGSANFIYPITGNIGIQERVDTFVDLNQTGILTGKDSSPVPTLADILTFTTTLSTSLSPKITINTPGTRLSDAFLNSENTREDKHEVVLSLSLPAAATAEAKPKTPVKATAQAATSGGAVASTKTRAFDAIDNARTLQGNSLLRDLRQQMETK